MDFNGASGEAADVTDIFESGREDYYRERAGQLIFTEVEEVDAFGANLDSEDFAGERTWFRRRAGRLREWGCSPRPGDLASRATGLAARCRPVQWRAESNALPGFARLDGRMLPSLRELLPLVHWRIGTCPDFMDARGQGGVWREINAGRVPEWD
jgi:hypothetical protein